MAKNPMFLKIKMDRLTCCKSILLFFSRQRRPVVRGRGSLIYPQSFADVFYLNPSLFSVTPRHPLLKSARIYSNVRYVRMYDNV